MRATSILVLFLAACGHAVVPPPAVAVKEETPSKRPPPGRMRQFHVGALDAFALRDGVLHEKNDGKTFGLGHAPAEVDALLGKATPTLDIDIQPLLVRDGARNYLFDTGALRPDWAPEAGALLASLSATGVAPGKITDVFVSHHHDDHVGGLVVNGALAFPNATIRMSAPEWAAMQATAEQADLVALLAPKVAPFVPGAVLTPSVRAVPIEGHTPGHSAYEIHSGTAKLLYIGDSAHHSVISVRRPDWPVDYDTDQERARKSRHALLERVAQEKTSIYAVHFPFPGLGTIAKTENGYRFDPSDEVPGGPPVPVPAAPPQVDDGPDALWRDAHGVTAWPAAACTTRMLDETVDECTCNGAIDVGASSFLVCQRPAAPGKGTGIQIRTILLAPAGKGTSVALDLVTSVGEDDALPNDVMGVTLEIAPTPTGIVLRDRDGCGKAISAVAQTARQNGPGSPWTAEVGVYRAICARAGAYRLAKGRFVR